MLRKFLNIVSWVLIRILKPFKLYAYRTKSRFLHNFILTLTNPWDFFMIFWNVQNETMLMHEKAYGGNFLFGRAVMVTDYAECAREIRKPIMKNNHFMGVNIVDSNSDVFCTNAPMLVQSPPIRGESRNYLNKHIFTDDVYNLDYQNIVEKCATIINDWAADPAMATSLGVRATVTRMMVKLLSNVQISKEDSDSVTENYMLRFGEASMFSRYFRFILELRGTRKQIRADAYFKLKAYGIDNMVIDMTLFAAMFSIGTLVFRCIEDVTRHKIDYTQLDYEHKRRFIVEAVRLYPTVTSVHRVLEQPETVMVANRKIELTPGDEIAYPFICVNRQAEVFENPTKMDLERPVADYYKVLSWSAGPHVCPAKDLSVLTTMILLDKLAEKHDLTKIDVPILLF